MNSIGIFGGTYHPADFTVGIFARAFKGKIGRQYEIAFQLVVQVIKLITFKPDVVSRATDGICLGTLIVRSRTCKLGRADVFEVVNIPMGFWANELIVNMLMSRISEDFMT